MSFIIDCFNGSNSNSLLFFKSLIRSLNLDTFLVEVEVIWVNNNDIFIRYNGKSIKIKQDQILAIEY